MPSRAVELFGDTRRDKAPATFQVLRLTLQRSREVVRMHLVVHPFFLFLSVGIHKREGAGRPRIIEFAPKPFFPAPGRRLLPSSSLPCLMLQLTSVLTLCGY